MKRSAKSAVSRELAVPSANELFDLSTFQHRQLFNRCEYVWDALTRLDEYLQAIFAQQPARLSGTIQEGVTVWGKVHIGEGTIVEPGAYIVGPTYIGRNCEIRHNAYIRGTVLIGDECIIGNSTEIKHSVLLGGSAAPHLAYIGDSILGGRVNLGAGTKLSNLPIVSEKNRDSGKRPTICIILPDGKSIDTGLPKLGAILGDGVQTGCNSVLNPGCIVGRNTWIYPNISLPKGVYPPDSIIKLKQDIQPVKKRPTSECPSASL
jgi:UDP-N-acetylglucosamine diphosphorylase / glucose-1-phosphate thymidylyltransferase / UDP-N-acetylgalactosamine diphosphorylase / glucosamine-1-phosphate N-acetyltransferase / galactosamine-1-phosphate N-acetyltransferase